MAVQPGPGSILRHQPDPTKIFHMTPLLVFYIVDCLLAGPMSPAVAEVTKKMSENLAKYRKTNDRASPNENQKKLWPGSN